MEWTVDYILPSFHDVHLPIWRLPKPAADKVPLAQHLQQNLKLNSSSILLFRSASEYHGRAERDAWTWAGLLQRSS